MTREMRGSLPLGQQVEGVEEQLNRAYSSQERLLSRGDALERAPPAERRQRLEQRRRDRAAGDGDADGAEELSGLQPQLLGQRAQLLFELSLAPDLERRQA